MATFSKQDVYLLHPCCPWCNWIYTYPEDTFDGQDIVLFMTEHGGLDFLPWIMAGSVDLATEFVEVTGIAVGYEGIIGRTALHFAALYMRPLVITYLLSKGASKIVEDHNNMSPLDIAYLSNDQATIDAMEA